MRVSEFFYSIQGEGATMGVPAVFLRLGGCNLLCGGMGTLKDGQLHDGATWRCDTIEVWSKSFERTAKALLEEFRVKGFLSALADGAHLVITGGEPMQQQESFCEFISLVNERIENWCFVEVETNGTILPTFSALSLVSQWNISPKLSNSGMPFERRVVSEVLKTFAQQQQAWCKLVISSAEDMKEVEEFAEIFFRERIILMPAADDREKLRALLPVLAEFCKERRFRLSTRMQVEIWNKTTGV
jgi:7-carboxy-7-deazaguanine synthase